MKPYANRLYCGPMNANLVDAVGMIGAVLTTVCWLPQAVKIIRSRDTRAISLAGTLAFTIGIVFWLIYGLALVDWPLITSNVVTLALMLVIVTLKLRHG
jgi:MtN3 and saliva related transmembrane protein